VNEWQVDDAWARELWPEARAILSRAAIGVVRVELADQQLDRKQATDLVLATTLGAAVAWRARRRDCRYRDLTLRYRRRAGVREPWVGGFEADKIVAGFATHYLYTWELA
jgi:hypothetical protein